MNEVQIISDANIQSGGEGGTLSWGGFTFLQLIL